MLTIAERLTVLESLALQQGVINDRAAEQAGPSTVDARLNSMEEGLDSIEGRLAAIEETLGDIRLEQATQRMLLDRLIAKLDA